MKRLVWIVAILLVVGCYPPPTAFESPLPRSLPTARRVYLPVTYGPLPVGEVWRDWPKYKFGVAAGALFTNEASVRVGRDLPVSGVANWGVVYTHAKWAAANGIVYFPRLQLKATFDAQGGLTRCEPTRNQEAEARRVALAFPGTLWDLFNEPDNLDLTAGNGCWDAANPEFAYRQAAAAVRYWVSFVRSLDPAARFSCCGELNGPSASYVRGVADAYRALYGEPIPLAAVSLHIYQVESWDLEAYQVLLSTAVANVDAHPDLRGLPLSINEGILLSRSLDDVSRERSAWLLYHWMDWLATPGPETDRVKFMAWWVDGLCSAFPHENPDWEYCRKQWEITSGTTAWPGTRLFDDKRLDRQLYSPAGEVWRRYWCNWTDADRDLVPDPCQLLGGEWP